MGEVIRRQDGDATIVEISGEVDLSWSSQIRSKILAALNDGGAVYVDLGDVSYIDSSGIATLVEGLQTAKGSQQRFVLVNVSSAVKNVLKLARLDKVFPIAEDVAAARAQ